MKQRIGQVMLSNKGVPYMVFDLKHNPLMPIISAFTMSRYFSVNDSYFNYCQR